MRSRWAQSELPHGVGGKPAESRSSHSGEKENVKDCSVAGVRVKSGQIHEKLCIGHRNHQVYQIMAEQLQEHGFVWTLEQCCYRFKNFLTNYCKARSTYTPGTSAFCDEMDALMSPWALANTFDALEVAGGHVRD
ncbi:hypothetical protein H8959_016524 [Pygathrix nigripes]